MPSQYPLRDIPIPYRYINDKVNEQNGNRLINSYDSLLDSNEQNKILNLSKRKRDSTSRSSISNTNSNDCENKRLKANDSTTLKIVTTPVHTEEVENTNITSTTTTNNTILEDALPLSPVASSGMSTPEGIAGSDTEENQDDKFDRILNEIKSLNKTEIQNIAYQLLRNLDRSQLADLNTLVRDNLKRDFVSSLPMEISLKILTNLSFNDIVSCFLVCTNWNKVIHNTPYLWKYLLISESFVSKENFKKYVEILRVKYPTMSNIEDAYKFDFLNNCQILKNWYNPKFIPQRTTLRGHMTSVVTCLQFEDDYVITGADDKMIRIYDSNTKNFLLELSGHEGGVWALKYDMDGIVVSGSTDRCVRVWDIKRGCCLHVFKGHSSTVRCLDIVEFKGIKYIITGSRDNTLHVWKLSPEVYNRDSENDHLNRWPIVYDTPEENPYFVGVLRGHLASVRAVSGHGNIVISGSYDNTLMVWDIVQMKCLYILAGHTDRIYSTTYDYKRQRCISASMDSSIRVWDLKNIWKNGICQTISCSGTMCTKITESYKILSGHTALVGLLKLSDKFLVSAAADGTLKGWDSNDYSRKFAYHHSNLSAITTFYMNDNLLVSGSEGQFNIYNLRNGNLVHSNILRDAEQIWSVNFKGRILVAAVEKNGQSYIEMLDFGIFETVPTIRL
ncbi:hypothetical protein KAFR_0C03190 [Kazachstania africana CBS 2517]|uniref:F-box domain-containing protein n=1 Tax=Kazachstania africana (strain ATCC 22294 / BCRC 22015 / CBS 2517 / CECT 1963 / NBRC 1671 / NRRL Y-8276) TaxID=1071382 RepID=H2ASG1_KAZAF|nr:hypothetical protein KAFR_0C03190 [Kazachstania africana CBS 2517]CCF57311.1 hypothetical protein KAFR_0C03190 [Kazachstania africana CBS 2517]